MRLPGLALCLLLAATNAFALDVRVLEPAEGARLQGGAPATIAWTSPRLPAHVEEWEAFLSFDGGASYAARLTPHLDARLQRFSFTVPNISSTDVRILLRFGDEEREEELELPLTLSIVATAPPARGPVEVRHTGERGTTMWAEGERDGSRVVYVVRRSPACAAPPVVRRAVPLVENVEPRESDDALALPPIGRATYRTATRQVVTPVQKADEDHLLRTMRLNI